MKIATPISHLFNDPKYSKDLIEISDCLECRDYSIDNNLKRQELFHCDLQPIHILKDDDFRYLEKIKKIKESLKLISFHMASCYDKPVIQNGRFIPGGLLLTRDKLLENASKNFKVIKNIFGDKVELAVENNNYYPTPAYNIVIDSDFITETIRTNKINFLFDIAHAAITSFYRRINLQEYIDGLPLNDIRQIHISKVDRNSKKELFDAHLFPDEKYLLSLKTFLLFPRLRYVTIEYYANADKLIKSIKYLREIIHEPEIHS
ncbi:MAG: DUF692 family protein [Bacteroidetes bacterium]|nr:DUF692 family protein [Bacteroidota bacterium]